MKLRFVLSESGSALKYAECTMIDIPFNNDTDFVGIIPFFCTTYSARISTKILLWINVDHPSAFRRVTWIIAKAFPVGFLSRLIVYPLCFRADKFKSSQTGSQVRFTSFRFHGKLCIMRTTGNTVFVDCIIGVFKMCPLIQWDIGTGKMPVFSKCITCK